MIRKSMVTGALVGLVFTLVALYPAFSIFVTPVLNEPAQLPPESPPPAGALPDNPPPSAAPLPADSGPAPLRLPGVLHPILLMMSGGALMLISLTLGSVASWRARARTLRDGVYAGASSGLVAGLVFYLLLVAPTTAVWFAKDIFALNPFALYDIPDALTIAFMRRVLMFPGDLVILGLAVVIGGIEGGLVGWLHRGAPPDSPSLSLLDAVEHKHGQRRWFALYSDQAMKAALLTGLLGGGILVLSQTAQMSSDSAQAAGWLGPMFQQVLAGVPMGGLLNSNAAIVVLGSLASLVLLGAGGLAAFLPKNPPSRIGARVYAAAVAGVLIGIITSIPIAHEVYFTAALLPELLLPLLNQPQATLDVSGYPLLIKVLVLFLSAGPMRRGVIYFFCAPPVRVALMYLLPLPFMTMAILGAAILGALQGWFYSLVFMALRLRPVDRARCARRDIARQPDQFLPRLYRLFQSDGSAIQVLEHLAFDLRREPAKARVAAAYQMMATQPAQHAIAGLELIAGVLSQHPAWRLQAEVGALHSLMAQGLRAGTVAQIGAIPAVPEERTSALPPLLAKISDHLSRVLSELKKVERVDDLNAKIIFLNNTLENLRLARIFSEEGATGGRMCCTAFPEFGPLRLVLDQWEKIVLDAVKDLQGRAELAVELKTRKLTFAPRLTLCLTLTNRGLNVAEDVRLHVMDCEGEYEVVGDGDQQIDILSPQETRELCFAIKPRNAGRLRVRWSITYDDALNDDRTLEFGELVEFLEAEKPFQRIFPIPYVTGTPLQTGQMFVGRQDVFDFVREHLLGTYQNNVIVLHGQRRTGKTSVLYRLGEVLADTHVCVLVDMQGKAARGEVDFLYSIADDIVYTLENKGIRANLPPRKDFEESPEFFFRSRFLRGVYDALGGQSLLLMFDEFEELQKRVQDGKLTADIFPYLRNLMQHERKVDFIFAGTHKLEELVAEYWSILFNIAAYKRITFLAKEEVTRLVTQPVALYGMEYDPLAVERIYQVAAGHPYFTQVVCHELVAYHNESQRSYLTTTDVDAALERIIERGEAHFKYIWAESSTPQRLVLLALAELLESEDAATPEDVAALLHKRGRPLASHELAEALHNLESRDIVMRSSPRSSLYRFRVDLIRRWIYAARPAYEKVV